LESHGAHRRRAGQSRQAEGPRPLAFCGADELFALAENRIALLRRARPINGPAATEAWLAAYRRGQCREFGWRYSPTPDFGPLRRALAQAAERLLAGGAIGVLYAERAAELELEARLAERIGQADFHALARRRHAEGSGHEWLEARRLAPAWAALERPTPAELGPLQASDDPRSPDSLCNVLAREIGRRRLAFRVEVVPELASRAACGDGVIFVAAGQRLTAQQARRVTLHELLGHALPRLAARTQALGLLRVGSARSNDDEEGRALHIEAAHELLDLTRRRELGLRHAAAVAVAGGADAHECVAQLGQFGCDVAEAVVIYARIARGGGLCRELEYLPAWLRFAAARHTEPDLARWLARGRLSLAAARVLRAEGLHPGRAPSTFSTCHSEPTELPVASRDEGA
jgi:hypothetical protein